MVGHDHWAEVVTRSESFFLVSSVGFICINGQRQKMGNTKKMCKLFHVSRSRYVHAPQCQHVFTCFEGHMWWVTGKENMRARSPLLLVKVVAYLKRTL